MQQKLPPDELFWIILWLLVAGFMMLQLHGCSAAPKYNPANPEIRVWKILDYGLQRKQSSQVITFTDAVGFYCMDPRDMEELLQTYCSPRCQVVQAR